MENIICNWSIAKCLPDIIFCLAHNISKKVCFNPWFTDEEIEV